MMGWQSSEAMHEAALKNRMIHTGFEVARLNVAGAAAHERIGVGASTQPAVIKQVASQRNAFFGERVIIRNVEPCWKASGYLKHIRCWLITWWWLFAAASAEGHQHNQP